MKMLFRVIARLSTLRAKQTYYNTTFDRFKHDIKRTWGVIDELRTQNSEALFRYKES